MTALEVQRRVVAGLRERGEPGDARAANVIEERVERRARGE